MITRVYLNDWFINCGLVGFLKILEHSKNEFAVKRENYIEFDTENLRNFHKYYFKYFYDYYDVVKNVETRTKTAFEYIQNNIEKVVENKEEQKQINDKIKSNKKYIKDTIKKQLEKIKKIDELVYDEIKKQCDKIDKEQTKEGIEEIKNNILENMKKEHINSRLTLNLFKSILTNTYYGQPSFLNVSKSSLSYEEQQELMYRDYISNIIETGFIQDIINEKYEIKEIQEYIKKVKTEGNISQEIQKIYIKIERDFLQKNKPISEIQRYLQEKVIKRCSMCEIEFGLTTDYSEGNFVPLAISSDNAKNFFWNQNVKFPICDMCKLILFCIPAGTTTITKIMKENGDYKEKQLLSFVNFDTNVEQLYKTNRNFSNRSKYENKLENPYTELILDIVEQDEKISEWMLQNIFVVEFEAEYGAYSRIAYFHMKRYVIEFFSGEYLSKTLSKIRDYKYKLQIVDCILKNKDMKCVINDRLREELKKEKPNGYHSFLATQTRMILNLLKKERRGVEKKNNDKLYILYNLGIQIHEELKQNKEENKLNGYTYKMLNCVKSGNKKEFMDIVIRIHMSMGKEVSPIFIETMQHTDLDFESIAHSFLAGLISNKYEKKENE